MEAVAHAIVVMTYDMLLCKSPHRWLFTNYQSEPR